MLDKLYIVLSTSQDYTHVYSLYYFTCIFVLVPKAWSHVSFLPFYWQLIQFCLPIASPDVFVRLFMLFNYRIKAWDHPIVTWYIFILYIKYTVILTRNVIWCISFQQCKQTCSVDIFPSVFLGFVLNNVSFVKLECYKLPNSD